MPTLAPFGTFLEFFLEFEPLMKIRYSYNVTPVYQKQLLQDCVHSCNKCQIHLVGIRRQNFSLSRISFMLLYFRHQVACACLVRVNVLQYYFVLSFIYALSLIHNFLKILLFLQVQHKNIYLLDGKLYYAKVLLYGVVQNTFHVVCFFCC